MLALGINANADIPQQDNLNIMSKPKLNFKTMAKTVMALMERDLSDDSDDETIIDTGKLPLL